MNKNELNHYLGVDEKLFIKPEFKENQNILLACILRIRNESLIIDDTLDHLANFVDTIIVYDDASTDNTFDICWQHPKVAAIIRNLSWKASITERLLSETQHRDLLLKTTKKLFNFEWCICADADERYIGNIRSFLNSDESKNISAIKIQLFDAYMTPEDCSAYTKGMELLNFRKYFGPEKRDIAMIWRNSDFVNFSGLDKREPFITGNIIVKFYCQHYGKSLSLEHWEETCNYYCTYFPYETYGKKWHNRKGKGIHTKSDFGRALFPWGQALFKHQCQCKEKKTLKNFFIDRITKLLTR